MRANRTTPAQGRSPAVTIVLPYFEGRPFLARAVESVQAQTRSDWELIVVDDGSADPAERVIAGIRDPRLRLVRIAHGGKGRALNRGIAEARAGILAFIDQDDLMLPGRLGLQLAALDKAPHADGVYSDYERRRADGTPIDRFNSREATAAEAFHLMAVGRSPYSMQTLMVRRKACERAGGFCEDHRLAGHDDADFFVRLLLAGARLAYAPGAVQCWIKHDRNFSDSRAFQAARLRWLRRVEHLAAGHPALARELRHFAMHAYGMRGMHFLEIGEPRRAAREFRRALGRGGMSWNMLYLYIKAHAAAAGLWPARPLRGRRTGCPQTERR
jgi:glycosyltransferase involved in cell wall biosynthesis